MRRSFRRERRGGREALKRVKAVVGGSMGGFSFDGSGGRRAERRVSV